LLNEIPRFDDVKNAYKRYCGIETNEIDDLLDEVSQIEEVLPKFDEMEI